MSREPSVAAPPGDPAAPVSCSRLNEALDALIEAFWLLDPVRDATGRITDFTIGYLNRAAARMAGTEGTESRGRLLSEVAPMAQSLGHVERYAAVVAAGEPLTHQFSAELADGSIVWRTLSAVPSGEGVAVTIRDVTERVVQERARAAAEDDLRLLAENAADMITRMTPDGRFTHVSPASRELMGFPPEEMIGRLARDFVHPDDLPSILARREAFTGHRPSRTVTYRARRRGGGWVRLESSARGIRDADGTLREIRASTCDVTERALVEAEHAALHRVSEAVATGIEQAGLYSLVAAEMAHLLDADGGRVVRYLDDTTAEVLGSWRRSSLPQLVSGQRLQLSPGWAIARARTTGATAVARLSAGEAAQAGADLRIGIAAPVQVEGRLWGAVAAAFRDPDDVADGAAMRVERFAKLVGLAVANTEARSRLLVQATTDALTGLANHGAFHAALADEFARTGRYRRPLSLAVIDLDRFKALNDTFGHRAGDAALATVGALLRGHARQADIVGRVGGEELGWLMPETELAGALEATERLRRAIAAAAVCGPLGLTASIGVARRSRYELDPDHLYRRADAALYRAKETGRDRVVVDPN